MSAPINNGGAAFPLPHFIHSNGDTHWGEGGMTLRDWFAGKAMATMLMSPTPSADMIAQWAYAQADAMIVARERIGGSK